MFYQSNFVSCAMGLDRAIREMVRDKVLTTAMHDNDDLVKAPKCHPGTRTAPIRGLITRAQDSEADCFLIWLVGLAGAGNQRSRDPLRKRWRKLVLALLPSSGGPTQVVTR